MKKTALIIVMMLGLAPVASAQDSAVAQEVVPEAASQMTGSSMLEESVAGVEALENVVSDVQRALEDAREASDVTRIDSLSSLLVNARGFLSVAQNAEINLKDSVSRNDLEAQAHHYRIIQLAVAKGKDIALRASDILNGSVSVSGTTVQSTVRRCAVEPCLGGEEYYEPSRTDILGRMNDFGREIDADASAYL